MKIPFVDLKLQYQSIKPKIDLAIQNVIDQTAFIGGEEVEAFEKAFAELHDARFCIGTSSGTDALHLILWSMGIGSGDEVIVPVNTFFATAEAVSLTGATPVFVDCDEKSYNIDVNKIEEKMTRKTKAIIPVHLYGQACDMDSVIEIACKYQISIVEDCCQAHLSEYKNIRVGTFGNASAFSFYPSKNLGAFGEGGAVVTNNEFLYDAMRKRHNHGLSQKHHHDLIGHNYRLEAIQAAILNVKLKYIEAWTEMRRQNAELYNNDLSDVPEVITPLEILNMHHVYHLYVIRASRRDELKNYLENYRIGTGIHYSIPLHLQKAYAYLGYKEGDFPVAEKLSREILSLPMYPELTKEEIGYIENHLWTFYRI